MTDAEKQEVKALIAEVLADTNDTDIRYTLKMTGKQVDDMYEDVVQLRKGLVPEENYYPLYAEFIALKKRVEQIEKSFNISVSSLNSALTNVVSNYEEYIADINILKEVATRTIYISDLDMGLDNDYVYSPTLWEKAGVYKVLKPNGTIVICVGLLHVYFDDMRHALYQSFECHYMDSNFNGHLYNNGRVMWTRQFHITDTHGVRNMWTEWLRQTYDEEMILLNSRVGTLERNLDDFIDQYESTHKLYNEGNNNVKVYELELYSDANCTKRPILNVSYPTLYLKVNKDLTSMTYGDETTFKGQNGTGNVIITVNEEGDCSVKVQEGRFEESSISITSFTKNAVISMDCVGDDDTQQIINTANSFGNLV